MDHALSVQKRGGPLVAKVSPAVVLQKPSVLVWMALAIALVAGLAYWDEERESTAALNDFAEEQATLAKAVSSALTARLLALGDQPEIDVVRQAESIFGSMRSVERPGVVRVLVQTPPGGKLVATNGHAVHAEEVVSALASEKRWVRLSRADAVRLNLPARTAMAGLSSIDAGPRGRWAVAVVATAARERDREQRARWRLLLSVGVASGLVLAFGGLALRKQRKELDLARDLAIAEVQKERDERLVRADKLATMGALATGIAHEVSTPLGVIVGRAEQLLGRTHSDERAKRAVEVISEQAERISCIIRSFLSLARGNAPTLDHVAPATLARNALELVEHRFANAGVELRDDIAADLPNVACEPRLFEQVIVNLLLNACDACEAGSGVELVVRTDGERVAFVVLDEGGGITQEAAARATEPFFTTKPDGKGTGLGLAIANEIVKHHCGTLTIDPRNSLAAGGSRAMKGTRACVELPVSARDHV